MTSTAKCRRVGLLLLWCVAIQAAQGSSTLRAHQLDEYVSLTHIGIERDRVKLSVSLTPGAEILEPILATIDRNGDGVLAVTEQRTYAERFVDKLALAVDDERPALRLVSSEFPEVELLRLGRGAIRLTLEASVDPRTTGSHSVFFANNNSDEITVYVIGLLKPDDPRITIRAQERDWFQRQIRVSFDVAPVGATATQVTLRVTGAMGLSLAIYWLVLRLRGRREDVLVHERAATKA